MKTLINSDYIFTGDKIQGILENKSIVIEDGRISEIVDNSSLPGDADKVIDAKGLKVFPGFIDLHVHLSFSGSANLAQRMIEKREYSAIRALKFACDSLNAGFTTLRDLGASGYQIIALKEAIRDGLAKGPNIIAAGRPITETGGHGDSPFTGGRVCDGPDDARKAVREQVKAGADVIKIHVSGGGSSYHDNQSEPQFSVGEIDAMVQEAHSKHRKVAAHAQSNQGIRNAASVGVDTIEHALYLDDFSCDLIKKNDLIIVPTMSPPIMTSRYGKSAGDADWHVKKATAAIDPHCKSIHLAKEKGLKIGFGTDAGTTSNYHGTNGKEFEFLVENGGLTPEEAIYAATGIASEALGPRSMVGVIAPGFKADLVFVEGNPFEDIGVLAKPQKIKQVILGGEPVNHVLD